MNIMNDTYTALRNAKLIKSGRQFSITYVNRNANWFAYQKHNGRDFSLVAAIDCLRSIRLRTQREEALNGVQTRALQAIENQLTAYLKSTFNLGVG